MTRLGSNIGSAALFIFLSTAAWTGSIPSDLLTLPFDRGGLISLITVAEMHGPFLLFGNFRLLGTSSHNLDPRKGAQGLLLDSIHEFTRSCFNSASQ